MYTFLIKKLCDNSKKSQSIDCTQNIDQNTIMLIQLSQTEYDFPIMI